MQLGTVKWFNEKKGFGFIAAEDGRDIFVHYSALEGEGRTRLSDGDIVEFEEEQGEKGPKATKVIFKEKANP